MKIVNLDSFREMPKGTLFSKYEPCCFDGLKIKTDTWEYDFLYQDLIGNIDCESSEDFIELCNEAESGESLKLDFHCDERDGCFEDEQLFAVYEKDDLENLIKKLQESQTG